MTRRCSSPASFEQPTVTVEPSSAGDTIRSMTQIPLSISGVERRAAILSVAVGCSLMAVKFTAYVLTGSSAIFSDALESIVNVLASLFALYSLLLAHRPADAEHPYGHGKIEFMSAGFEGGLILLAALAIGVKTLDTLLFHQIRIEQLGIGLTLVAAAMFGNGATGVYLIRLGRRYGSMTLEADGKHLLSDAVTSIAALAALAIVKLTGWIYADPIAALLIAFYIGVLGIGLIRRSFAGLMDEQDVADELLIKSILDSHLGPSGKEPRICSYHKLRHRHTGRYHWIDFHIMLPAGVNIKQGHAVASSLEYDIEKALGEADATAHLEPCTDAGCLRCSADSV